MDHKAPPFLTRGSTPYGPPATAKKVRAESLTIPIDGGGVTAAPAAPAAAFVIMAVFERGCGITSGQLPSQDLYL